MNIDVVYLEEKGVIAELAMLFSNASASGALLSGVDIETTSFARFGEPTIIDWWRDVCGRLKNGIGSPESLQKLLHKAADTYPGNALLQSFLEDSSKPNNRGIRGGSISIKLPGNYKFEDVIRILETAKEVVKETGFDVTVDLGEQGSAYFSLTVLGLESKSELEQIAERIGLALAEKHFEANVTAELYGYRDYYCDPLVIVDPNQRRLTLHGIRTSSKIDDISLRLSSSYDRDLWVRIFDKTSRVIISRVSQKQKSILLDHRTTLHEFGVRPGDTLEVSSAPRINKVIGIDLGTSYSRVAVISAGVPQIIENTDGLGAIPSVVAFSKYGSVVVGSSAKQQVFSDPLNTVVSIKRLIGRRIGDSAVKKLIDMVPYRIVNAGNGDAWVEVNGNKMAPPEILAKVLQVMKKTAEDYLGRKITEAVITVPAYFNDSQRQATKDAGRIAGLDVKRIINDPTAAALAYGLDTSKNDKKLAVYDLGGGTFDISIIEVIEVDGKYQFEVLSTNGDTFLGGEDFDKRLIDYLADEFKKDQGIDLRGDPLAMQRLKEAAERAKIELSSSQQTDLNLRYITEDASGPKHMNVKITRAELEALVDDLVELTIGPCKVALKNAGLSVGEIDDVILVGGQTCMPKVQAAVQDFFGKEPRRDVNPDEAVAIGAAIQGGVLAGEVKEVLLLDVTALSLGIETLGGVMTKLIEKNTTIPTRAQQVFSTADDNQSAVTVHVLQGEREVASGNKSLGRFDLTDIPPAPRGVPQIEVTFDIDANGILYVSAKDKASGKKQSISISASSGLSEVEIRRMVKDAETHANEDKKFHELVEARNQADGMIHVTRKSMQEMGEDKLEAGEKEEIEDAIKDLGEAVKGAEKDVIEAKYKVLAEISGKMTERLYSRQRRSEHAAARPGAGETESDEKFTEAKGAEE